MRSCSINELNHFPKNYAITRSCFNLKPPLKYNKINEYLLL